MRRQHRSENAAEAVRDGAEDARDGVDDASASAAAVVKPSAMARMREAERGMELLAMTRARAAYARDVEHGAVIMGVAKPGEDGWVRDRGGARVSVVVDADDDDVGGVEESRRRQTRFDLDDDGAPSISHADAKGADESFKIGVACLKRGDVREALEAFERAEAACPLDMTDARTKLLRTIAQTRALLAQIDDGDILNDGGIGFDGVEESDDDDDDDDDDATETDDDEFASVEDDTDDGQSETASEADANLADDAYRAAIWLLKNSSDGAPPDYEEIENLLQRARALCPPSQATAIQRIDNLLVDLAALVAQS